MDLSFVLVEEPIQFAAGGVEAVDGAVVAAYEDVAVRHRGGRHNSIHHSGVPKELGGVR